MIGKICTIMMYIDRSRSRLSESCLDVMIQWIVREKNQFTCRNVHVHDHPKH